MTYLLDTAVVTESPHHGGRSVEGLYGCYTRMIGLLCGQYHR